MHMALPSVPARCDWHFLTQLSGLKAFRTADSPQATSCVGDATMHVCVGLAGGAGESGTARHAGSHGCPSSRCPCLLPPALCQLCPMPQADFSSSSAPPALSMGPDCWILSESVLALCSRKAATAWVSPVRLS